MVSCSTIQTTPRPSRLEFASSLKTSHSVGESVKLPQKRRKNTLGKATVGSFAKSFQKSCDEKRKRPLIPSARNSRLGPDGLKNFFREIYLSIIRPGFIGHLGAQQLFHCSRPGGDHRAI